MGLDGESPVVQRKRAFSVEVPVSVDNSRLNKHCRHYFDRQGLSSSYSNRVLDVPDTHEFCRLRTPRHEKLEQNYGPLVETETEMETRPSTAPGGGKPGLQRRRSSLLLVDAASPNPLAQPGMLKKTLSSTEIANSQEQEQLKRREQGWDRTHNIMVSDDNTMLHPHSRHYFSSRGHPFSYHARGHKPPGWMKSEKKERVTSGPIHGNSKREAYLWCEHRGEWWHHEHWHHHHDPTVAPAPKALEERERRASLSGSPAEKGDRHASLLQPGASPTVGRRQSSTAE